MVCARRGRRQGWHVIILNLIVGVACTPDGLGIWLLWHVFRSPMLKENMGEVGYHISVQAARAALPRMREAPAAGTEVQFGPIAVSVNGIRPGKKTVPLPDVIAVELPGTNFSVKVKDRFSLFTVVSVHLIPNLRLLEILANELRTGQIALEGDVVRG